MIVPFISTVAKVDVNLAYTSVAPVNELILIALPVPEEFAYHPTNPLPDDVALGTSYSPLTCSSAVS